MNSGARLRERNEGTPYSWGQTVQRFICEQEAPLAVFSLADLEAYRTSLAARRLSPTTLEMYFRSIKLFVIFCIKHDWIALNEADVRAALKTRRVHTEQYFRVLSDTEIRTLLESATTRERAVLSCGLFVLDFARRKSPLCVWNTSFKTNC